MKLASLNNYWAFLIFIISVGHFSFCPSNERIYEEVSMTTSPKFSPILPIHIAVNASRTIDISATNTDDIVANNLPDFIEFTDLGNGNATITIAPNKTNTGDYSLSFVASNALLSTGMSLSLKVYPDNNVPAEAPVFSAVGNISMKADSTFQTWINSAYTNQIVAPKLPAFISLADYGRGASEIFIQPDGINMGQYQLEFFALGPHGIDTLNITLDIQAGLTTPQDAQCHLSTVSMISETEGFEFLFDEQYLPADPINNLGTHPSNPWSPGFDWSLYPTLGYIDLGTPQPITRLFFNDGIGGGTFNVYLGSSPTDRDTVAIASNELTVFQTWHEHEINRTTQFLFFEMTTPQALVTEVMIYGLCDLEIDTIAPAPITNLHIENTTTKTVKLSWDTSGDDLNIGEATSYDLRYSTEPITDSTFNTLPKFLIENLTSTDTIAEKKLTGLDCDTPYYFAIKAIDDVNNISTLSNIATSSTGECKPNISITVTFDTPVSNTPNIEPTKLRFNKDFAYSLTLDDGSAWEHNVTFPLLNGGITPNGVNNDGFYYTDGCGNEEAFRAGIAINGFWILEEPYGNTFMTWDEVQTLYQADWDILNHSFSHCYDGCDYLPEVIQNTNIVEEKLGFTMTHFAVPAGDNEGYRLPAFDNGHVAIHDQYFPTPHKYGIQVDGMINLDSFELHRNTLENETVPYGEDIDSVAILSQNGNHFWFSEYAHRVGYPTDLFIFVLAGDFKDYMTHIENNFGRNGADNLWFAPLQEVYEYIQVRNNIEITNIETNGNQITFQISTADLPTSLRRNSLSLKIDTSNQSSISNIQVTNSNVTFNSDGLINLSW